VALGLRYGRDLPVNPVVIVWALAMLTATTVPVGMWPHRVIILGALLVAGLRPVWHGDPTIIGAVLAGAATIVIGILDHRVLVRTLGRSAGPSLEARDAGA
jgi:hypothetical protein